MPEVCDFLNITKGKHFPKNKKKNKKKNKNKTATTSNSVSHLFLHWSMCETSIGI